MFQLPIEVDGRPLASVGPNEYARTELPAGRHSVAVPESYWTKVINGIPHPVEFTVEAGKSYYLLPTEWAGAEHTNIVMVGTVVVPERTAQGHSSFSVQTIAATGSRRRHLPDCLPPRRPPREIVKRNRKTQP